MEEKKESTRFGIITTGIVLSLFAAVSFVAYKSVNDNKVLLNTVKDYQEDKLICEEKQKDTYVSLTKYDLEVDIKKYTQISNRVKKEIVSEIIDVSKKYDINPLIIYGLIHAESSMKYWINHKEVYVTISGKKQKVKAIGLGGIVWEWWGNQLVKEGIAEVRSDLYDPTINIRATAFVYNKLLDMKMHKSAKNKDESAMLRYFGGDYISYVNRINTKIGTIVSHKLYVSK